MIYILILVFIIVFLFLNILYKNTNYFKNQFLQIEKFKNVPNSLDIINTGSSYAKYAFDYGVTSLSGYNFALQPQSLSYDLKILKKYTPNLEKGCVILITLPNLVFGFLNYDNDNANTKYYCFLDPKEIIHYSKLKYFTRIIFPILTAKRSIGHIIKDVLRDDSYNQSSNLMTKAQAEKDAFLRVEGWKKQFGLDSTITCNYPEELKKMFLATTKLVTEMIDYCLENDFRPVIIIPPTSEIINAMLSKEFMQGCLYDNICKSNEKSIPVLDYLYDERFQDYKLYLNSDFLNKTGREKFTQTVIGDLKKMELIRGEEL
jgi:hypothetical protein